MNKNSDQTVDSSGPSNICTRSYVGGYKNIKKSNQAYVAHVHESVLMWATENENEGVMNDWILPTPQFYSHGWKLANQIISMMMFY